MPLPIVTLTTDWTTRDYFVGKVKGRLYSLIEGVNVVDITHGVTVGDKTDAAFVVSNACMSFPKGTVHIVDVNGLRVGEWTVVIESHGQYFIMLDNGLPSLVFGEDYQRAVSVRDIKMPDQGVFLAYDLFCQLASMIIHGTDIATLGEQCTLKPSSMVVPLVEPNKTLQYITYIDSFGNAYLSIKYDEFEKLRDGRSFRLSVRNLTIDRFTPSDGLPAASLAQVDLQLSVAPTGHLMLSTTQVSENACRLFGLQRRQMVKVEFV